MWRKIIKKYILYIYHDKNAIYNFLKFICKKNPMKNKNNFYNGYIFII